MSETSLVDRMPVALLAAIVMGAAVAFFFFAMPMVLLEQGVIASGLPTLIAAAGPPLGTTARTLVATAAALAAGIATWLVVTLVDFIGRPRSRRAKGKATAKAKAVATPAPRPAPIFPDVPARRPIFASSDLGTPTEPIERVAPPEPEPIEWVEAIAEDDVLELVDVIEDSEILLAEPEVVTVDAHRAPLEDLAQLSISELMIRLEAGAKRRATRATDKRPAPKLSPVSNGIEIDGALRTALSELQRMALH